ncbi:PREDICTED: uncharacterized protein LOC108565630 [Nicrophorus vespilloides]|uniref:Uncharacterized protein LOC108565630 n=1 Tax=Nicrophorus vespilloides TaxID=110193 RepID=A0ABM1N1H6_NICVS|nr:PREDICTED: uncharacterized protein LOC108565630 [Nicrophorus vespilloides]
MKFFIVFACALAVASSGYSTPKYYGLQHLAVIGKGGVPIDTAEVQHARAAHFLHKAEAEAQSGHDYYYEEPSSSYESYNSAPAAQTYGYSTKIVHEQAAYNNQGYGSSYSYEQHVPMIVKGVPVDTTEVQQARAAHLAAHASQSYKNYQSPSTSNYGSSYGYEQHVPMIVKGVPVDTIEVQHVRAAHLAAHFAAKSLDYSTNSIQSEYNNNGYAYQQHVPLIVKGVPVDTIEVQHARAAHLQAHASAKSHYHHY